MAFQCDTEGCESAASNQEAKPCDAPSNAPSGHTGEKGTAKAKANNILDEAVNESQQEDQKRNEKLNEAKHPDQESRECRGACVEKVRHDDEGVGNLNNNL